MTLGIWGTFLPAILLVAIAASWPETRSMFRYKPDMKLFTVVISTVACTVCLGGIGAALQTYGILKGTVLGMAALASGEALRRTTVNTKPLIVISIAFLAAYMMIAY